MSEGTSLTATAVTSLAEIGRDDWDRCAQIYAGKTLSRYDNPFISYDFLESLELSGCATPRAGWLAQHIAVRDDSGQIVAVMPCYLKSHSMGEYVFDHAWADAFERAGGRYYPKLQASVPFTPVAGRRLLVRHDRDPVAAWSALASAATQLADQLGVSSLHITFMTESEWRHLGSIGLLQRTGKQFHWPNQGYATFEDFLGSLTSRRRKTIRKERERALEAGLDIEWLTGVDITEAHWDAFFDFYMDTGDRKWGRPYLNRAFFGLLGERMAQDILLVMAKRDGHYIAGALNFIGSETLFGRYWGAVEHHEFLHFEVCYYQAIDYAIAQGLATVEAGAQGPHKLSRGYLPVTTYSAHHLAHPGLRKAVADFLDEERTYVELENAELTEHAPYRKENRD